MTTLPLVALVDGWRARAAVLRDEGYTDGATIRERCASELEKALETLDVEALSAAQAARESGYSVEQIRRILRAQPELNCGRPGKPAIQRKNLPHKPGGVARAEARAYDAVADARALMSR